VTQAEWRAVMGWNESRFAGRDHPVEELTWFDCVEFCNRKSVAAGLDPAYGISGATYEGHHAVSAEVIWDRGANGYRMPTEAEWEFACRARTVTAFFNGHVDALGCNEQSVLTLIGWYCGNSLATTHPVKEKQANPWGLFDMHGNVWEWCWDWFQEDYENLPAVDAEGADYGTARVLRGGGCLNQVEHCRSAYRLALSPGEHSYLSGLRIVRNVR
jgi:formylglycine-generating enzyme required for sulfatase activity